MTPIQFEEANRTYTAEGCKDLPVYEYKHDNDQLFCISCWQPSEEDKKAVAEGRPILLQIYGGQPPVMVYTCDENGKPNNI